jgi:menaquinol-cytochrome c reductase iron-sulfur subunit
MHASEHDTEQYDKIELSRRAFMDRSVKAIAAFISISLGVPAIGYLISPALQQQENQWVKLGRVSQVKPGVPTLFTVTIKQTTGWVEVETQLAYFVYTSDGKNFSVMSNICTHLGCQTHWNEVEGLIECPCHGGQFDAEGNVIGGPPPRPLKRVDFKLDDSGNILSREV